MSYLAWTVQYLVPPTATKAQARPRVVVARHRASGGSPSVKRRSWECELLAVDDVGIRDLPVVVFGDDCAGECEWLAAAVVAAPPWRTGMLGAADAAVDAATSEEVAEEVVDTMLLDASAAADARAPMVDDDAIFWAPPPSPAPLLLPLDDGNSGLGSMTLLLPPEAGAAWSLLRAAAAVAPACTNFRRFFSGSSPRRHGLR